MPMYLQVAYWDGDERSVWLVVGARVTRFSVEPAAGGYRVRVAGQPYLLADSGSGHARRES